MLALTAQRGAVAARAVIRSTCCRALATASAGKDAPKSHFNMSKDESHDQFMPHPIYTKEELDSVQVTHKEPEGMKDKVAFYAMKTARTMFDTVTGYGHNMTEKKWLTRMIFLETVAGVPGMVGGMLRHMTALRGMTRDFGWIHTLLEEAENERMHLMTFLELRQPGPLFRFAVLGTQGIFFNAYFLAYLLSPKTCHRFVGYLEEEAVITYTKVVKQLEAGELPEWQGKAASPLARKYWRLGDDAKLLDVIKAIRADEMVHRDVNHVLAGVGVNDPNPFAPHYAREKDVSKHPAATGGQTNVPNK